jgi:MATE family multidrug resistance protein
MFTSISVHWLMLVVQYIVIVVYDYGSWVFVFMLIILALLYLRRLLGGAWRRPERLANMMLE